MCQEAELLVRILNQQDINIQLSKPYNIGPNSRGNINLGEAARKSVSMKYDIFFAS